jgi:predicted nucleotidyltransferase
MSSIRSELAATAARWVVEDGLSYAQAKHKAAAALGASSRQALPDNDVMEMAVFDYIDTFCAEEQAADLAVLRRLALRWMDHLDQWHPYVLGAVWRGSATRHSDITLHLFSVDTKALEIELINQGVEFDVLEPQAWQRGACEVIVIEQVVTDWAHSVILNLVLHDGVEPASARSADAAEPPLWLCKTGPWRPKTERGSRRALARCVNIGDAHD